MLRKKLKLVLLCLGQTASMAGEIAESWLVMFHFRSSVVLGLLLKAPSFSRPPQEEVRRNEVWRPGRPNSLGDNHIPRETLNFSQGLVKSVACHPAGLNITDFWLRVNHLIHRLLDSVEVDVGVGCHWGQLRVYVTLYVDSS